MRFAYVLVLATAFLSSVGWQTTARAETVTQGCLPGANLTDCSGNPLDSSDILSGTFDVNAFTVPAGQIVRVQVGTPLVVRANTITITGTLDGNAAGEAGGTGGNAADGQDGSGMGGGDGGIGNFSRCGRRGGGGGGGGFGGAGGTGGYHASNNTPAFGGSTYNFADYVAGPLGSGGGGGADPCDGASQIGVAGNGGRGGGSIFLQAASTLSVTGTVRANGAVGMPGTAGDAGGAGGGGGSGGAIVFYASTVSITGNVQVNGGNGGNGVDTDSGGGGGGGVGRAKVFCRFFSGSITGNPGTGGSTPLGCSNPHVCATAGSTIALPDRLVTGLPDLDNDGIIDALDDDVDGDGVLPGAGPNDDSNDNNKFVCNDTDADGCDDCAVTGTDTPANDGTDNDGDDTGILGSPGCDVGDPDDDNDGVPDAMELPSQKNDPSKCGDSDGDTCDDCSATAANDFTPGPNADPSNDGLDTDGDGTCNAGDPDDDNDGINDAIEIATGMGADPLNPDRCGRDIDGDGCDDCNSGDDFGPLPDFDATDDGLDTDGDGLCNDTDLGNALGGTADPDDDNDGVLDGPDIAPLLPNQCQDADNDLCDDCSQNSPTNFDAAPNNTPANDGPDNDGDDTGSGGAFVGCDLGDVDDDNDGVLDVTEISNGTNPFDPDECGDSDGDTCDDCTIGTDNFGPLSDSLPNNDDPDPIPDPDGDGKCNAGDPDDDNDTVPDELDPEPLNPDVCGIDSENGGVGDGCDDCGGPGLAPNPNNDAVDTDMDGLCDSADPDDDNDNVLDADDCAPLQGTICGDTENRGLSSPPNGLGCVDDGDSCDDCISGVWNPDADGDDNDGDGLCDEGDPDDDNDSVLDGIDLDDFNRFICQDSDGDTCDDCVINGFPTPDDDGQDSDNDGFCDAGDIDEDNDTISDGDEGRFQPIPVDTDNDDTPDYLDLDSDGDTIRDRDEAGDDSLATPPRDTNNDGTADFRELDSDGDGIDDQTEAGDDDIDTPPVDTDDDGDPDYIDLDSDDDTIDDEIDNCRLIPNTDQADSDNDGEGDACDNDADSDGVPDDQDNCPITSNAGQEDADGDGIGDVCDSDVDGDGYDDDLELTGGKCSTSLGGDMGGAGLWLVLLLGVLVWRRRRRWALGAGLVVALLLPLDASAQSAQEFPTERFRLAQDHEGILNVEWAAVPAHLAWDVALWAGMSQNPLIVERVVGGQRMRLGELIGTRVQGGFNASFSLVNYLQLAIDLPLYMSQTQDTIPGVAGSGSVGGFGIGDIRFAIKSTFVRAPKAPFDLGLNVAVIIPSSTADFGGENGIAVAPELLISRQAGPIRIALNAGYLLRGKTTAATLVIDDEIFARLGLGYRLDLDPHAIDFNISTSMSTAVDDPFGSGGLTPVEFLGGVSFLSKINLMAFVAGGAAINDGFGTPAWRVLAGLRYYRGDRDLDGDGLIGLADKCPNEAEDFDGYADTDGCPEDDADGDGVPDIVDKCPMQPETVNGHEDNDGCPDDVPDRDGDGIGDPTDGCVDQPEDKDGFEDDDGCPDTDNDGDGVTDKFDQCPDEKGPAQNLGCPDQDRDGDGIIDRLDNCPDEAGSEENYGCQKEQLVVIEDSAIAILEKVFFQTNSATILERSFALLDNVAAVVNAHPEIPELRIEGHTDDRGSDKYNLDLSQRRAESVFEYLVAAGVDINRLTPIGYGEQKPIAKGKSKQARQQNRRVEFKIVRDGGIMVK